MGYDFIWSSPSSGAPIVSIATYGITFNSAAIQLIGNPKKIMMGYDVNKKIIGIKPINDETKKNPHAFTFAERERKGMIRIGNKDFVKYVSRKADIDISTSNRYAADWDSKGELMIVDLTKPLDGFEEERDETNDEI